MSAYRSGSSYRSAQPYSGSQLQTLTTQLSGRARIYHKHDTTLTSTARINKVYQPNISMAARIQGVPVGYIYDDPRLTYDSGIMYARLSTPISFRARISGISRATVSLQMQARLQGLQTLSAKASLYKVNSLLISSKARVQAQNVNNLSMQASLRVLQGFEMRGNVRNVQEQLLQVKSSVRNLQGRSIAFKSRISAVQVLSMRGFMKDVSAKRRYVTSLVGPANQNNIPGRGDVIIHSNGNTYCVFAETCFAGVAERRLYLVISLDGGITWGSRIQLTSGNWDNAPSLVELDSGDIGMAFVRGTTRSIYRMSFSTIGVVTYGPATLGLITSNRMYPQLVKTLAGKFRVICLTNLASTTIAVYECATFTTATWSLVTTLTMAQILTSLSVRRHSSGQLMAVVTYASAYNGSNTAYDTLATNWALNLGVCISSDEGSTWSDIQAMSTTAWNASIDLAPHSCPLSGDIVEHSDGSIGIIYQEGTVHQIINTSTTPSTESLGDAIAALYDNSRDTLIVATGYFPSTYDPVDCTQAGGIQFYRKNVSGAFEKAFHLNVRSTPPIWNHQFNSLALSPDNRYLAVATDTGITIIDMDNVDHTKWVVHEYRTSSSPIIDTNNIGDVQWLSATKIIFAYADYCGSAYVWGGSFEVSDPEGTLKHLYSGAANATVTGHINVVKGVAYHILYSKLYATNIETGASITSWGGASISSNIGYDAVNDELLVASATSVYVLKFAANAFSVVKIINATTDSPRLNVIPTQFFPIGDNIGMLGSDDMLQVYNPATRLTLGTLHSNEQTMGLVGGIGDTAYCLPTILDVDGTPWLLAAVRGSLIWFMPLDNVGSLRYGLFDYNSSTKVLTEGDARFYDVMPNIPDGNQMDFPKVALRSDGILVIYSRLCDLRKRDYPFAPIITLTRGHRGDLSLRGRITAGKTATLALRGRLVRLRSLSMRGSVIYRGQIQIKARIGFTRSKSLTAKAHIHVLGKPTLSAKASIKYIVLRTLDVRARIIPKIYLNMKTRMSQVQGGPVPSSYDARINVFTNTDLKMRGIIGETFGYRGSISMYGRIYPKRTSSITARARVVSNAQLSMAASITARRTYVHLPMTFDARSLVKIRLRMVFYMQGTYGVGQLGMRTRILCPATTRFTAHFVVPMPDSPLLGFTSKLSYGQVFTAKAFITRAY